MRSRFHSLVASLVASLVVILCFAGQSQAQTFGFTTEPVIPVGDFSKVTKIGGGVTGYVGSRLGRKSPWLIEVNSGFQWHAGDRVSLDEWPGVPEDSTADGDRISISGWMFPIRASITRLFGQAYFSPRVGVYIPAGDLDSRLGLSTSFGVSPKIGVLFFVSRDVTADLGIEYTAVFDEQTVMYVGFSFGFLMGGGRLTHKRTPY
jgi:hypothetical protein